MTKAPLTDIIPMRRATLFVYFSFLFVIALFSGFIWFNRSMSKLSQVRGEGRKSHLRLTYDFQSPQTVDEFYANTQRFSVVIVTHNEALLEKTYPILNMSLLVYLNKECSQHS